MSWWYRDILGSKNCTKEIGNIHKDFELYQLFMHNFLCQNVPILTLQILFTRRIDTFWCDGIDTFCPGGIVILWHRKSQTKNSNIQKEFLPTFCKFCKLFCQTVPKSSFYILPKLLTIILTRFCVICHPNLFTSDLAYATRTNPVV